MHLRVCGDVRRRASAAVEAVLDQFEYPILLTLHSALLGTDFGAGLESELIWPAVQARANMPALNRFAMRCVGAVRCGSVQGPVVWC